MRRMDNPARQMFTRRAFIFGAANMGAMSVLLGRLYYLQFTHAEEYRTLAEDNRIKLQLITPVRGLILDRNGVALAANEKNFRLYLDTEIRKNLTETMSALARVVDLTPEKIQAVLAQAHVSRFTPPVLIKEHLTWDELSQFEFFRLKYPEVFVEPGQIRNYPFAENASQLIGYVSSVDKDTDDEDMEKLSRLPDFKIGKAGAEQMLEARLEGTAGVKQTEVNVHGVTVRELGRKPGKAGENIHLTIDAKLQEYASARLAGEAAAAVVMEVHTGHILAFASMPSYDPNSFSKGITSKYWSELQANPRTPLMNKAMAGQYPPGSTFKLSMGLAALEAGEVTAEQRIFCNGRFMYGNHQFTCWKPSGHGSVNLHDALQQSCDVYFYTMADRLGIDRMALMARRLGLGKTTGLGLPGERPGIVPDDEWKRGRYGQGWQGGDTINVGIGQGYILATPLQLAVMTARIANGGFMVAPRLTPLDKPLPRQSLGIDEEHIASIQDGMNAVVNTQAGTAYARRILDPRFLMAGKTGTSQVRKLIAHGMDQSKLPWEQRHHALFVAFAPVQAPKYAVSVIVEHGGGGGASAAPIARDILLKIQSIDVGEPGPPLPEVPKDDDDSEVD